MSKKVKYEVDLHCHSSASDGMLRPCDLVALAQRRGLKAIGLTDHDTIAGWDEAERAAREANVILIKGVEINTDWRGREVHILGYEINEKNESFLNSLLDIQDKRIWRLKKILSKLENLGLKISFEEVAHFANGKSIGRPHVAQALVAKRYANDVRSAFDNYLMTGAPAYVPRYKLQPEQAIKIIREAGGVAILAHPGSQKIEYAEIEELVKCGLQGIEISHPDHTEKQMIAYRKVAADLKLITTGGSDYHGPEIKPDIEIGDCGMSLVDLTKIINWGERKSGIC